MILSWLFVIGAIALLLWGVWPVLSWLAATVLLLLMLIWPFLALGLMGLVAVLLISNFV